MVKLKSMSFQNQVAQKYYADMGETVTDTSFATQSNLADEIMTKYYKGSTKITSNGMGTDDGNGNFLAFYSIRTLSGKAYSGGANDQGKNSSFICDNSPFYQTASGALFIFNDKAEAENQNGPVVCVDINGKKGPNRYGMDYFLFAFTKNGNVVPMGDLRQETYGGVASNGSANNFFRSGSDSCSNTTNNIHQNITCAYYALSNTHPNKTGKDYWNDFLGEVSFR